VNGIINGGEGPGTGSPLVDPKGPGFKKGASPSLRIKQAMDAGVLDNPDSPEAKAFMQGMRKLVGPDADQPISSNRPARFCTHLSPEYDPG
jgi:hypothetical protein